MYHSIPFCASQMLLISIKYLEDVFSYRSRYLILCWYIYILLYFSCVYDYFTKQKHTMTNFAIAVYYIYYISYIYYTYIISSFKGKNLYVKKILFFCRQFFFFKFLYNVYFINKDIRSLKKCR